MMLQPTVLPALSIEFLSRRLAAARRAREERQTFGEPSL